MRGPVSAAFTCPSGDFVIGETVRASIAVHGGNAGDRVTEDRAVLTPVRASGGTVEIEAGAVALSNHP